MCRISFCFPTHPTWLHEMRLPLTTAFVPTVELPEESNDGNASSYFSTMDRAQRAPRPTASSSCWRENSYQPIIMGKRLKKLHAFVLSICAYTWSHVHMFLCLWARLYLCFFFLYRRNAMCVSLPLTPYFFHVMAPPQECEWWNTKHRRSYWVTGRARQEDKGGVQGRGSGGIWGRQNSSQHSVACTSANERGKGSASNYTEIMAISWNHGNSSHPAPLPPPLPHPLAALSSYCTPPKWN